MSGKKKRILKTVSVADIGCNSCKKLPNFSSIFFNPFPKKPAKSPVSGRNYIINTHSSTAGAATPMNTTASSSSSAKAANADTDGRWFSDSTTSSYSSPFYGGSTSKKATAAAVAVEKDSDDPYLDFRQSMLQMVVENQIYSKNDLRELLNCFLRLNAPYHHEIIIRAFSDIWCGVFSGTAAAEASPLV